MSKNKEVGKKANVFKVAGAKSLKARSKAKPVTGNLKKNIIKMETGVKSAGIIIIGNGITKGLVKDENSTFLCKRFRSIGVKVGRITMVPDDMKEISEEVAMFSQKFDIVVTTGGIGPTHDDNTYQAIAAALGDTIILHREMAELIPDFRSSTSVDTNLALKMALIPQSSKIIYIPPITEAELEEKKNLRFLQLWKKPFPVVQVKNVYALPGIVECVEHAFDHLQKIFENPNGCTYTMTLFIKLTEMQILKELNKIVEKFQDRVMIGSYPGETFQKAFWTKIIVEGSCVDDVTSAYYGLKSLLPERSINNDLERKNAELVYELGVGIRSMPLAVKASLKVIEKALKKYEGDEIYISFNGGKDCLALLHLVWAANLLMGDCDVLHSLYLKPNMAFPEVEKFIQETEKRYHLNMITVGGSIKEALTQLHKESQHIKAIFMGTRRTDPHASKLEYFQMCDESWPPLMRVNPILDWSYHDIWEFIRVMALPYCSLYEEGYTSIGNLTNTRPNPALKINGIRKKKAYEPAYKLKDASLERKGRV